MQIDGRHIADIRDIPRISEEEQARQFEIYRENIDTNPEIAESAAEKIIVGNMRLVIKLAIEMYRERSASRFGTSVSLMDLIQDGYEGLRKSVNRKYNQSLGKFSTYAGTAITRHMRKTFEKNKMIQIPANHGEVMGQVVRIREEHDGEISDEEIAEEIGISVSYLKRVEEGQKTSLPISDLDSMIENGFDVPKQNSFVSPDRQMAIEELREYLLKKISTLSDKEKFVIEKKFFDDQEMSNAEIGEEMNMTRQGVDRIYRRAMKKLNNKIKEDEGLGRVSLRLRPEKEKNEIIGEKTRSARKTRPKTKKQKEEV